MKRITLTSIALGVLTIALLAIPTQTFAGDPIGGWDWEYVYGHMVDWNGDGIQDGCCCCGNYTTAKCRYKKTVDFEEAKKFDEFLYDDGTTLYFKAIEGGEPTFNATQDNSGAIIIAVPKTAY